MTDQGSGTWSYTSWTPSRAGTFPYTIYLQDTAGNWNAHTGSIEVTTTSSIPAFSGFFLLLALGLLASLGLLKKMGFKNLPFVGQPTFLKREL